MPTEELTLEFVVANDNAPLQTEGPDPVPSLARAIGRLIARGQFEAWKNINAAANDNQPDQGGGYGK